VESRKEESWENQGIAAYQKPLRAAVQVSDLARKANLVDTQLKILESSQDKLASTAQST
jgi:hypothetical protein